MPPKPADASAGIASLVASIKQHKKFRQLASYSVQCLCRAVSPPTVGWEKNLRDAYDAGAVEAINEVLQRHKGDAAVLQASTQCFASMATNSKYAESLVDSGAVINMIESVAVNTGEQQEGVKETLTLFETIATTNPEALLRGGGAKAAVTLIKTPAAPTGVISVATRTLEKLNKVSGSSAVMIECGAVDAIMALVQRTAKDDANAEVVEVSMRMLERMCRQEDNVDFIRRNMDGMQVLCTALEINKNNEKICKAGGRVLSKLASGNVTELVTRMEASTSSTEKEFLSGLLANLAVEEENADAIMRSGGVEALLKTFSTGGNKAIESSSRAIARLAANEENIDGLVQGGAISTLVEVIAKNSEDVAVVAAVTPTLSKFTSTHCVKDLHESGAVRIIMKSLKDHPEHEQSCVDALTFIDNLVISDTDLDELVKLDVIPAIIGALKAHPKNNEILMSGIRCLIYFSYSESNVDAMVAAGVIPILLSAVNHDRKDIATTTLYLTTSIALVPTHKEVIVAANGIDKMLVTVANYSNDDSIRDTADELLNSVVGEQEVAQTIQNFSKSLDTALSTKTKGDMSRLKEMANRLAALSATPEFADLMITARGADAIVSALESVSARATLPEAEAVLTACGNALTTLGYAANDNPHLAERFLESGAVKGIIASVKAAPKLAKHVSTAIKFIEAFAVHTAVVDQIIDEGGVEACVAALRANATSCDVVTSAISTMLTIAGTDKGAVAVAKHGGTRQVIATVNANVGTPGFQQPMEKSLTLLQRVAMTNEGADTLVKQGGVDAVIQATEVLTRVAKNPAAQANMDDSEITATMDSASSVAASFAIQAKNMSVKLLSRLMTEDDVQTAIEDVAELGRAAAAGRVPRLDVALPVLSKVSHMATVGNFADQIAREGGGKSLMSIVNVLQTKCDNSKPEDLELKQALLPHLFRALGGLSKVSHLPESLGVPAAISKSIEESVAVIECLECIKHIGSSPTQAAVLVMDGKSVRLISETLRSNIRDAQITTACFSALAALSGHPETAPVVAESPALALVSSWIDDNLEDAPTETVGAALTALSNMAASASHAAVLIDGGAVELVKAVLTKVCVDAERPVPNIFAASVTMLNRLGAAPGGQSKVSASGALRRVVRLAGADSPYIKDDSCVAAVFDLILASAASGGEVVAELSAIGVQDVIVNGMNSNGTSENVLRSGAAALAVLGSGEEAAKVCLDDVRQISATIGASAEVHEEHISALGAAVQRLGNFMMIPGVLTAGNAHDVMSTLTAAITIMSESEMSKPETLAAAVQSVGRVVDACGAASEGLVAEAVNIVMDVVSLNPASSVVRESAVHTLGTLAGNPEGLRALHSTGAIDIIHETSRKAMNDPKMQQLVDSTISKLTDTAAKHAAELVGAEEGTETLTAVVQAADKDPVQLATVLTNIAAVEGGEDALYDVIAAPSSSSEVMTEALRVLKDKSDTGSVTHKLNSAKRMQGLTKSLQAALSAQAAITASSDARTKLQALRMAESTLSLLSQMDIDSDGADVLFRRDGIDSLMQLLTANVDDPDTVKKIVKVVRGAMQFANKDAAIVMAQPDNMGTVVELLRMYPSDEEIAVDAVDIMAFTARVAGAESSGIDSDGMRAVTNASSTLTDNVRMKEAVLLLQATMSTKFHEAEAVAREMTYSLAQATKAMNMADSIQELMTDDGRTYYYDTVTKATSWEPPAVITALRQAMQAAQEATLKQQEDAVITVDTDTIAVMVNALSTHSKDATVATSAASTLSALAANSGNAEAIAQSGGIKAAVAAMQLDPNNVALLRVLMVLMERISRNDRLKEQIIQSGGLDLLIDVAFPLHITHDDITLKALSTLANLAFNSQPNIAAIMEKNGIKAVEKSLQQWPDHARILENAMCVLSNMMYGSDENKLIIGQTCGDEVTGVIRDHPKDVNLFKMALRALGNLAYCDQNIRFLLEDNSATKAIVAGMRANAADEEALQVAIEVIGNFASLAEPEPEIDEDGNIIDPKESISMIILREAGCAEIIATMKKHMHNTSIVKAGMDALSNIACDEEVTELMARKQNLIPTVIEIMQQHDWDEELIKHAVMLLATITYCREVLPLIAQLDGIQVLLAAMEQHGANHDLLQSAQLALANMANDETCRTTLRDMEGIRTILGIFEHNIAAKGFVQEALRTLTRLCTDDSISALVARDGMHIIMAAIERYKRDPEFLTSAFRLLGHLAFVEANLTIIVQHDGIQRVIDAITDHPDFQPLIVRGIQTLDNIAMANKENAAIVIDAGGKELIEMIMTQEQYTSDEDVQRFGKSALLSMSALENLSKSAEITAKAAKASAAKKVATVAEEPKVEDPLGDVRLMLSAGKIMKVWNKGSSAAAHVLVSPDFKSIVWQDVKTQKKLGALDLRQVMSVRAGPGDGHKRSVSLLGGKPADPALCFCVIGDRVSLDLECTTNKEQQIWVDALSRLHTVFRTTPHLL